MRPTPCGRGLPTYLPAWFCFTAAVAQRPSVLAIAIAIACTEPQFVTPQLRKMRTVTSIPLNAYPNLGRSWDASTHSWIDQRHAQPGLVQQWSDLRAVRIGAEPT
ncbi:MAG: hypothetical protein F2923_07925 [Actinobacteria bacterium]|nr:hypothetical protein [Actinomycetota bacterium]